MSLTWQPSCFYSGGHVFSRNLLKYNTDLPYVTMQQLLKFGEDIFKTFWVNDCMSIDVAAILFLLWRPCFFLECAEMHYQPTLGPNIPPLKIWWRYLENFFSYWSDVTWRGGHFVFAIAAMFFLGICWKVIPTYLLSEYTFQKNLVRISWKLFELLTGCRLILPNDWQPFWICSSGHVFSLNVLKCNTNQP